MFCETLHNIVHLIAGAAAAPGLAPQRFAWIACAVLHHRTPQRTSFKLIAFIACRRARAGAQARTRAPAPKSTRAAAASSGGVMYLLWSRAGAGAGP